MHDAISRTLYRLHRINGVVVTWVVAIDPPGVRFPLNAFFPLDIWIIPFFYQVAFI